MKQQLIKFAKKTGNLLSKNSPHIFTGLAVGGVVGTIVLAIKGTMKADLIIDDLIDERVSTYHDELETNDDAEFKNVTKMEKVKATWKCYIPTGISAVTTIAFIVASDTVNTKRIAAVSALYAASQEALKDFKEDVKSVYGEKGLAKITDKKAETDISTKQYEEDSVINTGKGNTLCYDEWTGRLFRSDIDYVKSAVNDFNQRLIVDFQMSMNEWYDYLGLDEVRCGDIVGFNASELLKLTYHSKLTSKGEPCLVIQYENEPKLTYRDW